MKLSILALSLVALVAAEEPEPPHDEATSLLILDTGNRLANGVTYVETFDMNMITSLTIMGETTEMKVDLRMDSETTPTDLPQGGQRIVMDITHIAYTADMGYVQMSCDTAVDAADADQEDYCDMFYDMVTTGGDNKAMEFVVDDEGRIAESSAPEDRVKSSGAADHLQASARLLQFIPTARPIQVGESWDSSTDLDGLGYFEGTSTFLGMDDSYDTPCALVSVVGTLDIDFQALMDKMGNQMGAGMVQDDIQITDSLMAAKTCWDNVQKMTVWSQTDMEFTMRMPNPMDPTQDLVMPIQETMRTTCAVKQDEEEEP